MEVNLDEVYQQMHQTGPEFDGWLSNHGPMAADAILRLGHGSRLGVWLESYAGRLEEPPTPRWGITEADWLEYLGDPSRLGDWTEFFAHRLQEDPWRDVLTLWWPRLLPGSIAASTHGLIRTGHAVRALLEQHTEPRVTELGDALGYWAARWQPLPIGGRPTGSTLDCPAVEWHAFRADDAKVSSSLATPVLGAAGWAERLSSAPIWSLNGGARARVHQLDTDPRWAAFIHRSHPPAVTPAEVPIALEGLVDAAVSLYAGWAHGNPVMLVHAATAPRAAGLVLPALPRSLWPQTLAWSWRTSATITAMYRPQEATTAPTVQATDDLAERAVRHGDEHVIKLTEVALESARRGVTQAGAAIMTAAQTVEAMPET